MFKYLKSPIFLTMATLFCLITAFLPFMLRMETVWLGSFLFLGGIISTGYFLSKIIDLELKMDSISNTSMHLKLHDISNKDITNMYLIHLLDGGFDSIFIVITQDEYDSLPNYDIDCNDPFFDKFLYDINAPEANRVFGSYGEVFDYVNINGYKLIDGFKVSQY